LLFSQANHLQIQTHREDKASDSAANSVNSSDDDSLADNVTDEEDDEDKHSNDEDPEGVMPDELDDPQSPVDGLQQFDWGSAEAELDEFLASGSEDGDSDTGSVTSRKKMSRLSKNTTDRSLGASDRSQRSNISVRGKKHPRDETDDDETDEESSLAKKQRLARVRTTGLKTVKTPNSANSESSLPTPEITGEEELDDADQPQNAEDESDVDDDLEAEMMAEFEKERDWGEEPQDDDAGYGDEDDDEVG
jgi:RNA polymerase II subunit A-like phosphatase